MIGTILSNLLRVYVCVLYVCVWTSADASADDT